MATMSSFTATRVAALRPTSTKTTTTTTTTRAMTRKSVVVRASSIYGA